MKITACTLLIALVLVASAGSAEVSDDKHIVWVNTTGIAGGDCLGFPLSLDHEPSETEIIVLNFYPRAYPLYMKMAEVCESTKDFLYNLGSLNQSSPQ